MAAFEYVALNAAGRARRGVLNGDSSRQIRSRLRRQGFHPIEVRAIVEDASKGAGAPRPRVSATALALLTRQLATLIRAGVPLAEALGALKDQTANRRLQSVLAGVRAQVMEGAALHQALAGYPGVFPPLHRNLVEAGEASGKLEEALERLADYAETRRALRQTISAALLYPAVLTAVSLLVVVALLTYVVPEVTRVFEQTGQELPLLTRNLIASSHFLRDYGWLSLAAVAASFLLWRWLSGRPRIRRWQDRLLLELPLIGPLNRTLHAARLARALAILTRSGVPLLEALELSAGMIENGPLRGAVQEAAASVREGGRLHAALEQSRWFPPLLTRLIAAGEDSGELDAMLERAASHEERELQTAFSTAAALLEPALILLMGVFVLVVVLAILLPIFEMNQLVGA